MSKQTFLPDMTHALNPKHDSSSESTADDVSISSGAIADMVAHHGDKVDEPMSVEVTPTRKPQITHPTGSPDTQWPDEGDFSYFVRSWLASKCG